MLKKMYRYLTLFLVLSMLVFSFITIPAAPAQAYTNNPPVLDPIGDKTICVGETLTIIPNATDPDPYTTLYYSIDGEPSGVNWDWFTHTFTWTPDISDVGDHSGIVFKVSDGFGPFSMSDEETICITVTECPPENSAPVLCELEDKFICVDETLEFTVTAEDDPEDTLVFSATGCPEGAFNPETCVFSWTPCAEDLGNPLEVCFEVTDGEFTDSDTILIIVCADPVLDPVGDKCACIYEELTFTLTASDPDTATEDLEFFIDNFPVDDVLDPYTGVFCWTPEWEDFGIYKDVVLGVTDGECNDTENITISVGCPPRFFPALYHHTVMVCNEISFKVCAHDLDTPAEDLVYSVNGLPLGATFEEVICDDKICYEFSWTPTAVGCYDQINFEVTDDCCTYSETIKINVIAPPCSGTIVYQWEGDLYTINADGTGKTQLTNTLWWEDFPAWSPDGTKIAFASNEDGDFDIYVMDVCSLEIIKLTDNCACDTMPSWNFDGSKIAFASDLSPVDLVTVDEWLKPNFRIWTMDCDGSDLTNISECAVSDVLWSEHGSKIAFIKPGDGLWTINPDGSDVSPVIGPVNPFGLSWKQDGQQIAYLFSFPPGAPLTIGKVNVDGSSPDTTWITGVTGMAWSPDGNWMCHDNTFKENSLFLSSLDGQVNVELPDANGYNPDWIDACSPRYNNPPEIVKPVCDQWVELGDTLELCVEATDLDGDKLYYSASNLPQGVAEFDEESHTLYLAAGVLTRYDGVTFTVTDGVYTVSKTISIQVTDEDIVDVPDSGLNAAIRAYLPNKPACEPLFASELVTFLELDASCMGIECLEGIQYMENLVKLNLCDNCLTDISLLSCLENLEELYICRNYIEDISPLAGLYELEKLFASGNCIVCIDALEYLTDLDVVDLTNNKVEDITPLVNNDGFGDEEPEDGECYVLYIQFNCLDIMTPESGDLQAIAALQAKNVTVYYDPQGPAAAIDISVLGDGIVWITVNDTTTFESTDGWAYYPVGANITLDAIPESGWQFLEWCGDITSTNPHVEFVLCENMKITAKFVQCAPPETYTLTILYAGDGEGTVTPDSAGPYTAGQVVQLTAAAAEGSSFSGWAGVAELSENPTSITMDSDKTVTASFILDEVVLPSCTIDIQCSAGGSVTCNPNQATYTIGQEVTLTANTETGYHFTGWGGCPQLTGVTTQTVQFSVYAETCQVTANFALNDNGGGGGNGGGGSGGGGFAYGGGSGGSGGTSIKRITSLYGMLGSSGAIIGDTRAESADAQVWLDILKNTKCLTRTGSSMSSIIIEKLSGTPSGVSAAGLLGAVYSFTPEGATFDPGITLTFKYDPASLPDGIEEENLKITWWDKASGTWVELESVVNTATHTVSAVITHFSYYSVMAGEPAEAPAEAPAAVEVVETPAAEPAQAEIAASATDTSDAAPAEPAAEQPASEPVQAEVVAPAENAVVPAVSAPEDSGSSNLGTILLSIAGALLVAAVIVAVLVSRARKHRAV